MNPTEAFTVRMDRRAKLGGWQQKEDVVKMGCEEEVRVVPHFEIQSNLTQSGGALY